MENIFKKRIENLTAKHIQLNPFLKISHTLPSGSEKIPFPNEVWTRKTGEMVMIFSKGQWAIKEFASSIIKRKGKVKGKLFIPEYFCEISLTPLRFSGFDLHFYRLTSSLKPDIVHLNELSQKYGLPDILLYVHYFGFPSNLSDTQNWCKRNSVIILEDAAHSMVPVPGIGDNGNPVFYTPWKFIKIPDGAVLVLPEGFKDIMKDTFDGNAVSSYPVKWLIKECIRSGSNFIRLPLHTIKRFSIKGHDESEPKLDPGSPICSAFSINILSRYGKYLTKLSTIREKHYKQMDSIFLNTKLEQYRIFKKIPDLFAPYVYPLRVPQERSLEIMTNLNRKRIPAVPWSDLSPEVNNSPEYPMANALRREIITLPIHQDLSLTQMDWMARKIIDQL